MAAGGASEHAGVAIGQRDGQAAAGGQVRRAGDLAAQAQPARSVAVLGTGAAVSSAWVYGWVGRSKTSSAVPSSTTCRGT